MKIDFNTVAEVAYKILLDHANGEMIEYADEDNPRRIVLGQDDLIPGFEEGLRGKTTGPFSFPVRQDKAFGAYDSALVTDVPKQAFLDDGVIREDLLFTGNRVNFTGKSSFCPALPDTFWHSVDVRGWFWQKHGTPTCRFWRRSRGNGFCRNSARHRWKQWMECK